MEINGSILTKGPDNFLPLNTYRQQQIKEALKLHLRFEGEDGSTNIIDNSQSNHTIINNKNILGGEGNYVRLSKDWSAFGKTSAYFDGKSSLSFINNSDFTFMGPFTIQFWMKSGTYSLSPIGNHTRRIFSFGSSLSADQFQLLANNSSGNNHFCGLYSNSAWRINGNIPVFNNIPHHILISRDMTNTIRLFVDGNQSGGTWVNSIPISSTLFQISGFWEGYETAKYEGYLDEFEIYNGVCLHNSNFIVPDKFTEYPDFDNQDYSGVTIDGKVGQNTKKYSPMYFDLASNTWKISNCKDINTLPAKALSLEDVESNNSCKLLQYGIVKKDKIPTDIHEYKSILPIMSSIYQDGIWLRASSQYSGYEVYKCIGDRNRSGTWSNNYFLFENGYNNFLNYFQIKLDKPRMLKSYKIYPRSSASASQTWTYWRVKGSLDGVTWKLLDSVYGAATNYAWSTSGKEFKILNDNEYLYYQFFDIRGISCGELFLYDENGNDIVPDFTGLKIKVSSSSEYSSNYSVWRAFDKSILTNQPMSWVTANNNIIGWLQIDLGYMVNNDWYNHHIINQYSITTVLPNFGKVPKVWSFLGSDNGIDWQILDHHDDGDIYLNIPGQRCLFNLDKSYSFRYYKLDVIESFSPTGSTYNYLEINEFDILYNNQSKLPKFSTYENKSCPSHVITSSSEYSSTYPAWKVFNKNSSYDDAWITLNGVKIGWIQISFLHNDKNDINKTINKYALSSRNISGNRSDPKTWTLQGSDDNIAWNVLDSQSNITFIENERKEFILSQNYTYNHYKLDITEVGVTQTYVQLGEWELLYNDENIIPNPANEYNIYYDDLSSRQDYINMTASSEFSSSYPASNCWVPQFYPEEMTSTDFNWYTSVGNTTGWVQIELIDPSYDDNKLTKFYNNPINSYSITTSWESVSDFLVPKSWTFEGSFDGSSWDILHSIIEDTIFIKSSQEQIFMLSETVYYKFYKLNITESKSIGAGRNYLGLFSIKLLYNNHILNPGKINLAIPLIPNNLPINMAHTCKNKFEMIWNQDYDISWSGYKIFDKITNLDSGWHFPSPTTPYREIERAFNPIFNIQLSEPKKITGIHITFKSYPTARSDSYNSYGFFRLKGSKDGINWKIIYINNDYKAFDDVQFFPYNIFFENDEYFSFYEIDSFNNYTIYQLDLYEDKTYKTINKNLYITDNIDTPINYNKPDDLSDYYIQNVGHILHNDNYNKEIAYFDFNSTLIRTSENILSDTIISTNTNLPSDLDGPMITKIYSSLTINSGITLTTSNRCRGLRLVVLGDCTINGTITMSARGANYPAPDQDFEILDLDNNILTTIPRIGGLGGDRGLDASYSSGMSGYAGVDGGCGGGGAGGCYSGGYRTISAGGGRASCFSGGAGAGGSTRVGAISHNAAHDGGRGSDASLGITYADTYYIYGGVGNPSGRGVYRNASYINAPNSGTGGLLILIVYGNLILNSTGVISANGVNAQGGGTTCLGGGGASGGGSINIFHKGSFDNSGTIQANGGIGTQTTYTSNAYKGGNGGAGSIRIFQI